MNDKGITTVWLALGLGLAYLSLNLLAATQQWPLGFALPSLISFEMGDIKPQDVIATKAFYGVLLVGPALFVLIVISAVYAQRARELSRARRIPASSAIGVLPDARLGKVIQAGMFILLIYWPTYALGHFLRTLFGATAECEGTPTIAVRGWDHLWRGPPPGCPTRFKVEGLWVYEPFWTPWTLTGIGAAVAVGFLALNWLVLRPRRQQELQGAANRRELA